MSPIELITAFFSIVFGLALAHILSGVANALRRPSDEFVRLVWAATLAMSIILNWWVAFAWSDQHTWTFEVFLLLVVWTMSFYGAAIALFPSEEGVSPTAAVRNYLKAFVVVLALDTAATATRTGLFSPWYYLLFVGYLLALTLLGLGAKKTQHQGFVAVWTFASILIWALVVRRLLA